MFEDSFDFLAAAFTMHFKLHNDGGDSTIDRFLLSLRFRRRFFLFLQNRKEKLNSITRSLERSDREIEEEEDEVTNLTHGSSRQNQINTLYGGI